MKPCSVPGFVCGGWVKDAHGLKGHLYIQVYSPEMDWSESFNKLHLFNSKTSEKAELSVREFSPFKDGFRVALDELNDRTAAEKFKGYHFLIPEEWLEADMGEQVFLAQLKGFQVLDKGQFVGVVDDFATNTVQDLLVVGDDLIPLIDEFLIEIDFDHRQIKMKLPPGLLGSSSAGKKDDAMDEDGEE